MFFLCAVTTMARLIISLVSSESLRKGKNKQFCVHKFHADREFHELKRQGGKLVSTSRCIVDCHKSNAKFCNKL